MIDDELKRYKFGDTYSKIKVIEALGKSKNKQVINFLFSALESKEPEVRYASLKSLENFSLPHGEDEIARLLNDTEWFVRVRTAILLEKIIPNSKGTFYISLFNNDNDLLVKMYCAFTLIRMKKDDEDQYFSFLISCLNIKNEDVVVECCKLLGDINDRRCIGYLEKIATSTSSTDVKIAAVNSLKNYPEKEVIAIIIDILFKEENPIIKGCCLLSIGDIGDKDVVELLLTLLDEQDSYVRSCVIIALGNIGDDRAIDSLINFTNDDDSHVSAYAKQALKKIGI